MPVNISSAREQKKSSIHISFRVPVFDIPFFFKSAPLVYANWQVYLLVEESLFEIRQVNQLIKMEAVTALMISV